MNRQFANRREAGRELARAVASLGIEDPIIFALPRGGVPLGYEVARALDAPLDILLVRKIGAPGHEEYGIGALVDGASPQVVINENIARMVGATSQYIEGEVQRQLAEVERRRAAYGSGLSHSPRGRNVILVDDGIATGGTVRAALKALRKSEASRIVLAVPVAPKSALQELEKLSDDIVCLSTPDPFYAVGAHYSDFDQTSDAEVVSLLADARTWSEANER
ncbi:putative phosphoribosyl transferase [Altererythrobacter xiamenensis]|uniref:Putative phosphoribosyl transferase n=1 Tax=Altererythrobacter xiamenensis TaxID=1316679 RepID=A0A1Y6FKD0_9SPHN|nr:phosphoribosyltransferase [Altererythrobacter xiamenensis]SMQ73670.1 putative phosphoribosyl transferase [Altererythrobacter xiamenensis]